MKMIHVLSAMLIHLLFLAGGAGVIAAVYLNDYWARAIQFVQANQQAAAAAGALAVLLELLYLLSFFRKKKQPESISFRSGKGRVTVSIQAVRDYIEKVENEFAAVLALKPALTVHHGKIDVLIDLRVSAGTQIPELCDLLQQRIRETVKENLGLQNVRHVQLNVREIVPAPPSSAFDEAAEAAV